MEECLFKLYEEIMFVLNNVKMFILPFDLFNKAFSYEKEEWQWINPLKREVV